MVHCVTNNDCHRFHYWTRIIIPIRWSRMTNVRIPESPPHRPTMMKTMWITSRRSCVKSRCARKSSYEWPGSHCLKTRAMPILLLHAVQFQMNEIELRQWHHYSSITESQPSSTNRPTLTVHHPLKRCDYAIQAKTRLFHNQNPVQMRMFPNTRRLLSR
jgi:hypothetical protein